jgi:hypothetical protein
MESIYHIVAIRVNETSWAHVWRLHSHFLGMGYDKAFPCLGDDLIHQLLKHRDLVLEGISFTKREKLGEKCIGAPLQG